MDIHDSRPDPNSLNSLLRGGIGKLNLKLTEEATQKLLLYIELILKWNKVHNLTAIRNPKEILIRHIFDSLAITPFIKGPNILDFGSGAGLPGIPLALALPNYNFTLLDSSSKKTNFLNQVVIELQLKNVKVANSRIEQFHFDPLFATIVTRATTSTDQVWEKTKHLCEKSGEIIIMKGKLPEKELELLETPFEIHQIQVPYLDEERHVVKIINGTN